MILFAFACAEHTPMGSSGCDWMVANDPIDCSSEPDACSVVRCLNDGLSGSPVDGFPPACQDATEPVLVSAAVLKTAERRCRPCGGVFGQRCWQDRGGDVCGDTGVRYVGCLNYAYE